MSVVRRASSVRCRYCGTQVPILPLSVLPTASAAEKTNAIRQARLKRRVGGDRRSRPSAFSPGLALLLLVAREIGLVDFFWCRSNCVTLTGGFPSHLLGREARQDPIGNGSPRQRRRGRRACIRRPALGTSIFSRGRGAAHGAPFTATFMLPSQLSGCRSTSLGKPDHIFAGKVQSTVT